LVTSGPVDTLAGAANRCGWPAVVRAALPAVDRGIGCIYCRDSVIRCTQTCHGVADGSTQLRAVGSCRCYWTGEAVLAYHEVIDLW
jgi:hypothetical protein